jgi:nucleoside-diphosphate-sugar epimerase
VWDEPDVVRQDLDRISAASYVPWQALNGKTVLVSGATGLIGSSLVKALLWYDAAKDADLRVLAPTRDRTRAEATFARALAAGAPLSFVEGDIAGLEVDTQVDLIVHGASVTSSQDYVRRPVQTIRTTVEGTERILEIARQHDVESVVYLSSVEVYGAPDGSRRIAESDFSGIDPMVVRSSYPEGKRIAEALTCAYATEFGVHAKVIRPTLTFGPGIAYDEARVFASFARSALSGRDLVLHTPGETERSYLYTADAVTAILTVLLKGQDGQAYNAANEETYCSIRSMADLVARTCGPAPVAVRVETQDGTPAYPPTLKMDLDTAKLQALGWRPTVGLEEMYARMVAAMGL